MAPHANMRSHRAPSNERRSASQLPRPLKVSVGEEEGVQSNTEFTEKQ